ncbi:UNVERIFIED_CONTAM: hypothetical protein Sradi_1531600 [Sesamum radiatum]|uniref:Uncharacterized protein n=1 Tax=Sesamum radiatum TaxID=300843 RepID=A0AAW2U8T5_SESRA
MAVMRFWHFQNGIILCLLNSIPHWWSMSLKNFLEVTLKAHLKEFIFSITKDNYGLSNAGYHTQLFDVVFIQTASLAASEAAIYLASMVESAVVSYLKLFQATTPPLSLNTKPDRDLTSSSSDWKLASI